MIDYWEPEGTRIQDVAANLRAIEDVLTAPKSDLPRALLIFGGSGNINIKYITHNNRRKT